MELKSYNYRYYKLNISSQKNDKKSFIKHEKDTKK